MAWGVRAVRLNSFQFFPGFNLFFIWWVFFSFSFFLFLYHTLYFLGKNSWKRKKKKKNTVVDLENYGVSLG